MLHCMREPSQAACYLDRVALIEPASYTDTVLQGNCCWCHLQQHLPCSCFPSCTPHAAQPCTTPFSFSRLGPPCPPPPRVMADAGGVHMSEPLKLHMQAAYTISCKLCDVCAPVALLQLIFFRYDQQCTQNIHSQMHADAVQCAYSMRSARHMHSTKQVQSMSSTERTSSPSMLQAGLDSMHGAGRSAAHQLELAFEEQQVLRTGLYIYL